MLYNNYSVREIERKEDSQTKNNPNPTHIEEAAAAAAELLAVSFPVCNSQLLVVWAVEEVGILATLRPVAVVEVEVIIVAVIVAVFRSTRGRSIREADGVVVGVMDLATLNAVAVAMAVAVEVPGTKKDTMEMMMDGRFPLQKRPSTLQTIAILTTTNNLHGPYHRPPRHNL